MNVCVCACVCVCVCVCVCERERERERDLLRAHGCSTRKGFPKELGPCRKQKEGSERDNIPSGGDGTVGTKAEKKAVLGIKSLPGGEEARD